MANTPQTLTDHNNQLRTTSPPTNGNGNGRFEPMHPHSSRASIDSKSSRFASPAPHSRSPSIATVTGNGDDMINTKVINGVLLNLLESKDPRIRTQMLPVLSKMLHFDE